MNLLSDCKLESCKLLNDLLKSLVFSGLEKLRILFGESIVNARTVTGMLRSKWESDPYTMGGYSYMAVGGSTCSLLIIM